MGKAKNARHEPTAGRGWVGASCGALAHEFSTWETQPNQRGGRRGLSSQGPSFVGAFSL